MSYTESGPEHRPESAPKRPKWDELPDEKHPEGKSRVGRTEADDDDEEPEEKPEPKKAQAKEAQKAPVETALGKLAKEIEGAKGTKGKISKEQLKALVGDAKAEYDKYKNKALAPEMMSAYEQDAKVFRAIDESNLERHVRRELKTLKSTIRTAVDKNAAPMSRNDVTDFASYKAYRESRGERNVNRFDYAVFKAGAPFRAFGNLLGLNR